MHKFWDWSLLVLLSILLITLEAQGLPNLNETCVYRANPVKSPCNDERYTCDGTTKTCVLKQCKYDAADNKPYDLPLCPDNFYCPYDQTKCLMQIALGGSCSVARGDVCQGAPDVMCFQGTCSTRSVALGESCEIDHVSNYEYDNCLGNAFCSPTTMVCVALLSSGSSCSHSHQCQSTDCFEGVCRASSDSELYHSLATWVYIVIGVGCFVAILLCASFIYFRRRRRMRNYKQMLSSSIANLNKSNSDQSPNSSFLSPQPSLNSSFRSPQPSLNPSPQRA
ncbi:hypothetical protein K493DRAFT_321637 [Basidiobolus meristosporus CBS 931.73]|uniref:EB domain-containing protein n=1 Tax=Basidiobolus meristosporus CBS 931.73 TaxID=1314790 RepID=A0A1Y1WRJ1_9FUNG|nr:hypothetical protein K493DRAFT_321637 [Basidiobolus meristosporus CBS 931.73]|eukprot:ORX75886.1 hypothetical protein K493DRAFT_321637 [Basidiobolus meristosporus CBS 931.73]